MLVYRDAERPAVVDDEAATLDHLLLDLSEGRGAARELATEALIEAGVLEAAVVDKLNPSRDGFGPREAAWRAFAVAAARLFRASRVEPERIATLAQAARRTLERARKAGGPSRVGLRTPEGYAWYALYPETYLEAARRFVETSPAVPTTVIGLRGIGASLSAVVAVELEAAGRPVESLTLRPRGDPFDRKVRLNPTLSALLSRRVREGGSFLIIDEGPGMSGSSFASVAEALSELGAGDEQIVFFPSVNADGDGLNAERGRRRWSLHRKVHIGFDEMRPILVPELAGCRDLSGGLWRDVVCGPSRPPVAPQHERRKYLSEDSATLSRFAGLGRRGRERLRRQEALAGAGFAAEPRDLRHGFLSTDFLKGRPLRRRERDRETPARAAAYVGWIGREGRTGDTLTGEELFEMLERNVDLAFGSEAKPRLDPWRAKLRGAPAVAVDGRMAPHEWVRSEEKVFKTDALDHGDDHFLPGPIDVAWDVAGFAVEWGLTEEETSEFAADAAREAGDERLPERLPFYTAAYLALRMGWADIAASGMPEGPDQRALKRLQARYRSGLARALQRMEGRV